MKLYSTVDDGQKAQKYGKAIERLQQVLTTQVLQDDEENDQKHLTVATMQVNVQFLSTTSARMGQRFVTIVKQQHKLDEVSYHKLFDILKQYQKEVNELRAERMAKNANPLALLRRRKTCKKYGSLCKVTSENSTPTATSELHLYTRNNECDTTPRYKRTIRLTVLGIHEGSNVVGVGKNVAEQSDWLADTDEEIDEQELEAHYSYMAKIQEVPNADSGTDAEPLEHVQYDTDDNVFANDIQHFKQSESMTNTCAVETECDDERVALANLIANLKLDVDENKKIQKQLKKANATLTQELTECKSILAETSRTLGESNSIRDSCLVALQNKQTEFERFKAFNDRTVDYDKLERRLNETLGLLAQKK
ncbi:hypothetical protein Tco_0006913 [Tanacetum coccineum]